jgi:chemotaxis protein MotB
MRYLILVITALAIFSSSCKPIYECGQASPEKKMFVSKRVQNVILERDMLCRTVAAKENEIKSLKKDTAALNSKISEIEKQYADLINTNLSQAEQFDLVLKQKSDELKQKSDELKLKSDELKQKSDELIAKEKLLYEREKVLSDLQQKIARQDSITQRLNDVLRNALLGFNSDELSVEIKNGKVYVSMSDKLLFKSGSAAVEAKGKEAIKVLSDVLEKNTDIDILVEGHTDNIPIKTAIYRDNWDLSVARATTIVRILIDEYKIEPTRLTASGKGEFSPRTSNDTTEGRASNRRTEIILSPKLDEIMKLLNYN